MSTLPCLDALDIFTAESDIAPDLAQSPAPSPEPALAPSPTPTRVVRRGSPLRWYGGKRQLARTIISLMPEHVCYCEPFAGAAHVLYAKPPSKVEVLNDINAELVNFYQVLAHNPQALISRLSLALTSRKVFEDLRDMSAEEVAAMTQEDRAWRFFYINRCSYCGRDMGQGQRATFGYNVKVGGHPSFRPLALGPRLAWAHSRIADVIHECLPWRECLDRYDSGDTFFYVDPPYYGYERRYGKGYFDRRQYAVLADALAKIRGKFLLSINDTEEARETFGRFHLIAKPSVNYSAGKHEGYRKNELLFGNWRNDAANS